MAYAFVGAALTTLLVYLIGTLAGGRINPVRLTLAGVAIGAVLLGITTGLSLIDPQTFDQLRFWQAGTLDIRTLSTLPVTAPRHFARLPPDAAHRPAAEYHRHGEDRYRARRTRGADSGRRGDRHHAAVRCGDRHRRPNQFHRADGAAYRPLVGRPRPALDPALPMLLAPILLLCADVVGRLLAAGELRVSIVAAFIGAPVLIWLVRRKKTLGAVMSLPHTLHIGRPDGVINGRMPLRLLLVNISLLALCPAMAVAALCYGTLQLSGTGLAALSGEAPKNLVTVVTQWRLPRIAMALLLGGALGMSGAIFQSIIRNPLGSPDVIGFNMGAYTGALIAITLFNGGYYYIAGGALAGGILRAGYLSAGPAARHRRLPADHRRHRHQRGAGLYQYG